MGLLSFHRKPAPLPDSSIERPIPDVHANIVSRILFAWVSPLLAVGITRPLQKEDLWTLDFPRSARAMADTLEGHFYARMPPARRPRHLKNPQGLHRAGEDPVSKTKSGSLRSEETLPVPAVASGGEKGKAERVASPASAGGPTEKQAKAAAKAKSKNKLKGTKEGGKILGEDGVVYDQNLLISMIKTFIVPFGFSAFFLFFSTACTTLTPIVTKRLLAYITTSYEWSHATDVQRVALGLSAPAAIGRGLGLAFGLVIMTEAASIFQNHYMQNALSAGMQVRSAMIAVISRKALRLNGASRVKHPNGQLITFISSDASFLEWSVLLCNNLWIQPIAIVVCLVQLIINLGPSALVGVGVLLLMTPVQGLFMKMMIRSRQAQLRTVDKRVRLLQEVLNGIRVIKLYSYEMFFKTRIQELRGEEIAKLRKISLVRATMTSSMSFMPVLAAVLTFVTYSLTGHSLSAANVFASLQLFNTIKSPLQMLPMAMAFSSDAYVAIKRMERAMLSDELQDDMHIQPDAPFGVRATGDFAWESSKPEQVLGGGRRDPKAEKAEKEKKKREAKEAKQRKKKGLPEPVKEEEETDKPFGIKDIDIEVARGSFTCIVGRVGSGKSSLLQGLIGEMKRTNGDVVFGGNTSYFSQQPWVINATLKENILFGRQYDEARFQAVIDACALGPDLEILPDGLETEIGEKGINLSGGQKARVCLARAAYYDAEVVLLDDPLSAVDAHVAKHITQNCFASGPLAAKTRILVTHHLDVLPHSDHIIVMDAGRIAEQGTYNELVANGSVFAKLIEDFGTTTKEEDPVDVMDEEAPVDQADDLTRPEALRRLTSRRTARTAKSSKGEDDLAPPAAKAAPAKLMQDEERETGAVSWSVWTTYGRAMGHATLAPGMITLYMLSQAANVGNTIVLSYWTSQSIDGWTEGKYMGVYAALGASVGVLTFCATFMLYVLAISASYNLFNRALDGVIRSRIAWFDTTPIGRITSRLSKDVTTLDNQLPMEANQLMTMAFSVFGTIALVGWTYPLLLVIFPPMFVFYGLFAMYYRASSREVKRLDSVLRSFVYTDFGEMVGGMASVRAYRAQQQFTNKTEAAIDVQNSAFYMTVTLQCWLGIRLEALGNLLVLAICLLGVGLRDSLSPSKIGVVLTYSLSVTGVFSQLVSVFATVEQDMNTAERVSYYGTLTPEGALTTDKDPDADWPTSGQITFQDVRMSYREGLPEVLKGVTFATRPGEKVGIVGRTGAGKSSLLQALFRIVELNSGKISIDGKDISEMGLDVLRKRLSVIPQDALLYAGTVRQNLDPTGEKSDAELNSALARAGLIAQPDAAKDVADRFAKFKLDASVADDGSNFSAGERQLVALCRALVKNSKVIILDEATSSVDVETDSSVQQAIQHEFAGQSLLCVAHRLSTIVYYDRVLVMDQGQVAEFDSPLALFDEAGSIFRSMCDKAGLNRQDIVRIRVGAGKEV